MNRQRFLAQFPDLLRKEGGGVHEAIPASESVPDRRSASSSDQSALQRLAEPALGEERPLPQGGAA